MRKMFKSFGIQLIAIILVVMGGFSLLQPKIENYFYLREIKKNNLIARETAQKVTKMRTEARDPLLEELLNKIPEEYYLEVPFICQAPLETEKNWTLHEESCEEAALLQAYLHETGKTMTKEEANKEILSMISWQKENLGGHHDLYAEEMVKFVVGFYDIPEENITVIKNATIEDIKRNIVNGHAVIVPITGQILKNPYYPYPGYHMLTVIGFTKNRIITNDNGTRHGKDFSYENDIFMTAMKDAGGNIIILNLNTNLSTP